MSLYKPISRDQTSVSKPLATVAAETPPQSMYREREGTSIVEHN